MASLLKRFIVIEDRDKGTSKMEKITEESKTRWITSSGTQIRKHEFDVWGQPKLVVRVATKEDYANVEKMKIIRNIKSDKLDKLDIDTLKEIWTIITTGRKK